MTAWPRCWNAMPPQQQGEVIVTNRFDGYQEWPPDLVDRRCDRQATVAVEQADDVAPGPRMYCLDCAAEYLAQRRAAAEVERRATWERVI